MNTVERQRSLETLVLDQWKENEILNWDHEKGDGEEESDSKKTGEI